MLEDRERGSAVRFLILQHIACEGLGLWEDCCREAGIVLEVVDLSRAGALPPRHGSYAVISLGGPMNVYETAAYPFLAWEDDFIRQVVADGVPFLGICLGGQLLAKAVGGQVAKNGVKEIGWHPVELDLAGRRDPLFAGLPDRFTVFQWHGDTFSIPKGGIRLATAAACENQAFRFGFGGAAYALQFHLEVTPAMVADWVREYAAELARLGAEVDAAGMLAEAPARCEELRVWSRRLFQNFCRLVSLRYAGVGPVVSPERPPLQARGPSGRKMTVEQARQVYRDLMAKGKLRCGVTCPLDKIEECTGGCW